MSQEIFGTDGVRGEAGRYPLDDETVHELGAALGTYFEAEGGTMVVAGDTRESTPHIKCVLTEGLQDVGVNVVDVGVLPTPGLAYTVRERDVAGGIMVTASHNPYRDNGIKAFTSTGGKLTDGAQMDINDLLRAGVPRRHRGSRQTEVGLAAQEEYVDFLVGSVPPDILSGMRFGLDMANGAASKIGTGVFEALGAKITAIGDEPNGRNINEDCGATNTGRLQQEVEDNRLHGGVALDGDADRVMLVDEYGRQLNGDHIMYMLALSKGLGRVVATVMTNLGTEQALQRCGIKLERTDVGDRNVLERLEATKAKLGGEQSGHIILPRLLGTGDGMLAAVQALSASAVRRRGKSLAAWRDEVPQVPQHLVNIPVSDKSLLTHPQVQQYIKDWTEALGSQGRVLIRPSGTELKARVMVEAPNAQRDAELAAAGLQELLQAL